MVGFTGTHPPNREYPDAYGPISLYMYLHYTTSKVFDNKPTSLEAWKLHQKRERERLPEATGRKQRTQLELRCSDNVWMPHPWAAACPASAMSLDTTRHSNLLRRLITYKNLTEPPTC
ncbi:unnamed protein product [Danaus chrysippus]|uniref:(African queen) hypothetical protein n=1 Tax=Danaus chrysippus TaxID=151541 RepID=A0A8J2W4J2_9NEOP|nr:unnamed protein product [Danaus chrysippus]